MKKREPWSSHGTTTVPCEDRFVTPTLIEWWQSIRYVLLIITFMIALALAGSFISYEQVIANGHPWLPTKPCPGCALCGMTRSFCAMSSGRWHEAMTWNRGGPVLYLFGWLWLLVLAFIGTRLAPGRFWHGGPVKSALSESTDGDSRSTLSEVLRWRRGQTQNRKPIWRRGGCALTTALMLIVASCSNNPDPPSWRKVLAKAATESVPSNNAVTTTNHLVVYLDTSGSMAGYVSTDRQGQTIFSRSLQELRNFISIISPPIDVVVRRVDSNISPPYPDSYLSEASVSREIFTGKETDIAGAITLFEKGVQPISEAAHSKSPGDKEETDDGDKDPLPPARFHVLVTDGVQSRTTTSADASCLAGSDQTCVRKRILTLLTKGWASYVIGIRSEFQGKVYSEVARGSVISYESKRRDPQSFRPFYIYLFSPDRAALDGLVGILTSRLRPLLASENGMRTLSLTSDYSQGSTPAEIQLTGEATKMLSESKPGRHQNPTGFTMRVAVSTDKKGPVPFQIRTTLPWAPNIRDGGTPKELAELVSWKVVPLDVEAETQRDERARYPEIKITDQHIEPDGVVTLTATAQYPGGVTGKPMWRSYCLEGRLNLDQQVPPWIRQWSTNLDTTVEAANKTLYLESTLLGLWNNPELGKQPVARIYLRLGP